MSSPRSPLRAPAIRRGSAAPYGIEASPEEVVAAFGSGMTDDIGERLLDVALRHRSS